MTPAEAAVRSRRAQGLSDHVTDDHTLDAIAALIAATAVEAGDRCATT
jgi:hypothetical protein